MERQSNRERLNRRVPGCLDRLSGQACLMQYTSSSNSLALMQDSGSWTSGVTLPSGAMLSNSYCSIDASLSSVTKAGTDLTVNVALTFTGTISGDLSTYLLAQSVAGATLGFQQEGNWTASGSTAQACQIPIVEIDPDDPPFI